MICKNVVGHGIPETQARCLVVFLPACALFILIPFSPFHLRFIFDSRHGIIRISGIDLIPIILPSVPLGLIGPDPMCLSPPSSRDVRHDSDHGCIPCLPVCLNTPSPSLSSILRSYHYLQGNESHSYPMPRLSQTFSARCLIRWPGYVLLVAR